MGPSHLRRPVEGQWRERRSMQCIVGIDSLGVFGNDEVSCEQLPNCLSPSDVPSYPQAKPLSG